MNLILTLTWSRMKNDCSIYSEKFKREVNRAHRKFFEKRGIDPDNLPQHLRSWSLGDRISSSFPQKNDPPIPQSAPKSFLLRDILKQMNGEDSEKISP